MRDIRRIDTVIMGTRVRPKRSDYRETSPQFNSRKWYPLYSDLEAICYHTEIFSENGNECVDVLLSGVGYYDDNLPKEQFVDFIFRLPNREIVEIGFHTDHNFSRCYWEKEGIREIIWRIVENEDIIFALAKEVVNSHNTEDILNFLRNKIDGKIVRKLLGKCPYCHGDLSNGMAKYTAQIPVMFYMHAGNFGLFEDEVYQSIVDAASRGEVAGECLHCHHELTVEDINAAKSGWQYPWRYDPHIRGYERARQKPKTNNLPRIKTANDAKILWCLSDPNYDGYDGIDHGWVWYPLYLDEENDASFAAFKNIDGKEYVTVSIGGIEYFDARSREQQYVQLIVRLPDMEILEAQYPSDPNFRIDDLQNSDIVAGLQRIVRDQDVIFALARKVTEPDWTEDDLNALRDKISGKILRSMPIVCPYCHSNMTGERVMFKVHIPVDFTILSDTLAVYEKSAYQSTV